MVLVSFQKMAIVNRSVLDVLLDSADTILAFVDAVEDVKPAIDGHGHGVKLDTVDEGGRCAVDALGGAVLPERTKVRISAVRVAVTVAGGDIGLLKVELGGDQSGPQLLEVVLGGVSH